MITSADSLTSRLLYFSVVKPDKDSKEPNVVRYQTGKSEFEYVRFWDGRAYEDSAERLLLRHWLGAYPQAARWLLDIGGSFGRLIPIYAKRFKRMAILDYATNEFHIAEESAANHSMAITLVAANAYHLPLTDNSQQAMISVRLVHHLEEPAKFFQEVSRVLAPTGIAIVEVSNKNHLKLFIMSLLKLDFRSWSSQSSDVGSSGLQTDNTFKLIRSYRPAYIEKLMQDSGLVISKKCSVSWLRRTPFAKLPRPLTNTLERFLQTISPVAMLAPSNWYILYKSGNRPGTHGQLEATLARQPKLERLNRRQLVSLEAKTSRGATYLDLRYPDDQVE